MKYRWTSKVSNVQRHNDDNYTYTEETTTPVEPEITFPTKWDTPYSSKIRHLREELNKLWNGS